MYERGERTTYEAVVSLTDQSVVSWRTDPGRAGADHGGGVHRLRGDRAGRPALAGGDAQARRHGLLPDDGRPVGVELDRPGRRRRQPPHRAAADVRALGAGRERLRPPGGGPDLRGRPRRARGRRGHRPRRRPAPARAGQLRGAVALRVRATCRRSSASARTSSRSRSPSPRARASPSTATPSTGRSGSVRIGFTPREGLVLHQVGYAGRSIVHRASLVEMYVPYGDPAPTHRFKNVFDQGEYGVGLAGQLARAGLRLRRAHPLLRRRRQRQRRRLRRDPQRHLHARGGRGHRVEAHGLPHRGDAGAAAPSAGDLLRSPPSATTSTGTSGTSTPTARSSTRSSSPASSPPARSRRGRRRGTARSSRPGLYGPHHQHFFCVRLDMAVDGAAEHRRRDRLGAQPARAGQPARQRVGDPPHRAGERGGGAPRHRHGAGALLEDRERRAEVRRWARRRPTR